MPARKNPAVQKAMRAVLVDGMTRAEAAKKFKCNWISVNASINLHNERKARAGTKGHCPTCGAAWNEIE